MNLEITGKLIEVYPTQIISDRFSKREIVLEMQDGQYTSYAKMQLTGKNVDLPERFQRNDMVKVAFNIKGNRYEKEGKTVYFTNLEAWKIEKA